MTARPVAPVIPAASPGRRQGKPGAGRPMPLARPPGRPDVVYGFGRIDASGRVADRATITALGWRGGDRLTLTADAGVMMARGDPGGMVTVPARPCIVIPAALRRRCGLRAGDHVLLAALPGEDLLAAYSFAVVDQAMRAHGRLPRGEGGVRRSGMTATRDCEFQSRALLPRGCLELHDQFRRHPPAVLNLNALGLGPLPNRGGVGSVGTGRLTPASAWPPSSSAWRPASGVDVPRQRFPQRVSILSAQVDLILRAVQPEAHCGLCLTTIEVIYKQGLNLLRHACTTPLLRELMHQRRRSWHRSAHRRSDA